MKPGSSAARMQCLRTLLAEAIPDPNARLTALLAVSDYGYACAEETVRDLLARLCQRD